MSVGSPTWSPIRPLKVEEDWLGKMMWGYLLGMQIRLLELLLQNAGRQVHLQALRIRVSLLESALLSSPSFKRQMKRILEIIKGMENRRLSPHGLLGNVLPRPHWPGSEPRALTRT